jgi:hypothetical protein
VTEGPADPGLTIVVKTHPRCIKPTGEVSATIVSAIQQEQEDKDDSDGGTPEAGAR